VHYQFRWFEDFSGGKMTDWGAHHNDIAQWALKMDDSGPTSIEGTGHYHEDGPHDVPGHFDVKYVYPNGVEVHCHSDGRNGVKVTGSKGELFVSRGEFEPSDPKLKDVPVEGDDYRKDGQYWDVHYKNWRECMESRDKPICDVEIGHRSATMCHLGNIAIKLGRKLEWDPQTERFTNDDQANLLVSKPMRSPWRI
jgi:predicted dehydrogenase